MNDKVGGGAMGKAIYVVLTDTGTVLSKIIGMYTGSGLNHASIALDEKLTEMYSFGRKYQSNPFIAGFVKENTTSRIFQGSNCAIYSYRVNEDEFDSVINKVRYIEKHKKQYRYNFIGLFGVAVNKGISRERAFFCSQFVATVMNEENFPMFAVSPNLMQPRHFAETTWLQKVYEGDLQEYLQINREQQDLRSVHISV